MKKKIFTIRRSKPPGQLLVPIGYQVPPATSTDKIVTVIKKVLLLDIGSWAPLDDAVLLAN